MPFPTEGKYEDSLALVLRAAHKHFLTWKKLNKLKTSQPRFTPSRLSRKTRAMYPVLSSKAVASKVVTFWVTECAMLHAGEPGADNLAKMVATCCRAYASTLQIMDTSPLLLMSPDQGESYYQNCMTHLQTYAALHKLSRDAKGKEQNRCMWLLICKHHHFYHHAKATITQRLNPLMTQLLCAEDWIGRVGRIARVTHSGNTSLRTLERYLALLHIELEKVA